MTRVRVSTNRNRDPIRHVGFCTVTKERARQIRIHESMLMVYGPQITPFVVVSRA